MAALLTLAAATPAAAGDSEGRFRVEGIGRLTCADFVAARREDIDGDRHRLFVGWIDGYLGAANRYEPDTFDLTPWQTIDLIAAQIAVHCESRPAQLFAEAAALLVGALRPRRLRAPSEIDALDVEGQRVFLPRAVVIEINTRLRAAGHMSVPPGPVFDARTVAALKAFQTGLGLPATGVPDQPTLNALLN